MDARGRGLSIFAHACLQSHRRAWSRLLDSGESHAIVVEDDVVLAPGLAWLNRDDWFPVGVDIVKLETYVYRAHVGRRSIPGPDGRRLVPLRSEHPGVAAYALSRDAAALFMRLTEAAVDPVDVILFRLESGYLAGRNVLQMVPAPFVQRDRQDANPPSWARSDIFQRSSNDAVFGLRAETLLARLRRRAFNQASAALRGTRYIVVPYG